MKIKKISVWLCIIIVTISTLMLISSPLSENAIAGTPVGGIITSNTTWDLAGSPYFIVSNVTVSNGTTLTIEPGVEVLFNDTVSIFVNGTLSAVGNENNVIKIGMNPNLPPSSPKTWWNLSINSSGHATFDYCNITDAQEAIHLFSSNNSISNCSISNNDKGIYLYESKNNVISNSNIFSNGVAIRLELSSNNIVVKNNFSENNPMSSGTAVWLGISNNNTFTDNIFYDNNEGLEMWGSLNNTISNNTFLRNDYGGIDISTGADYNVIINNTFLETGQWGICIGPAQNNTIKYNYFSKNEDGIRLTCSIYPCSNNFIVNNTINNNTRWGIYSWLGAENTIIAGNVISRNKQGIMLVVSFTPATSNIITGNDIVLNEIGINFTQASQNNRIYHNNFLFNNIQAADDTADNQWDDGYPSGGNYWSDYSPTCQDLFLGPITPQMFGGSDGICDFQYDIDVDSADYYPLTELVDVSPPIITNLKPPDGSTVNTSMPTIGANYSDISGIDVGSVLLKVDGSDVTSSATVTPEGVTFTPTPFQALFDGVHIVYLEVKDTLGHLATETWSFTVDTTPPTITNLQPPNTSTTNDDKPIISADYSDTSGIDTSSVVLKVDGIDVTSSATVKPNNVTYTPFSPLTSGPHTVYLEVEDIVNNLGKITWTFTIDNPPKIEVFDPGGTMSQTYIQGDTITVTWNATDDNPLPPTPINITYGFAAVWTNIATLEVDDGSYNWDTSAVPCPGTYWMNLSVYDTIGQTTFDETNYSFDIFCPGDSPPTITAYEPGGSGGQTYIQGNIITVTWNANDDKLLPVNPINITYGVAPIWNTIAAFETNDGSYSWNTSAVPCPGTYWMNISVYDSIGQTTFDESNYSFSINCSATPDKPTTTIHVGLPQYSTTPKYVTSSTQIWFTITDPSGTGYSTYYYVDTVPEITYTGSFTIPDEGGHKIYYYSVDNLGGTEELKEFDIIVDNTPPITSIDIGEPKYISGDTWVTSTTEITLSPTDGGLIPVGTDYTEHRIWNNGPWSTWEVYTSAFTLDVDDGITYVEFYSIDYLGNREITNNETYSIDNTPPATTHILQLESDNTEARISLIANDVGSGVNYTKYRVDSGDWETYSGTFIVNESGWHTIYFWSVDRLGNTEVEKNFSVFIEEPGTVVPPGDGEKEVNWKPLIALIFTIILLIVGTYASFKRPLKIVKGNKLHTWLLSVSPFVVAEALTGVISLSTGALGVPPLLGPGMILDLAVFITGLITFTIVLIRGKDII